MLEISHNTGLGVS